MIFGLAVGLVGCGSASTGLDAESTVPDTISLLSELDAVQISGPPPDSPGAMISLALFLHLRHGTADPAYRPAEIEQTMVQLVRHAQQVFAQCGISVAVEFAATIQLPVRLRNVQGNEPGSWGGHPPPGTTDPALFNYSQNERLTDDTREIFDFAKRLTSPNSIAVVFVEAITYHTGGQTLAVDGLSFAPNLYHHVSDYPLRNSVLSRQPSALADAAAFVMAHEVGHMVLNSALHVGDPTNLMNEWGASARELTALQCERALEMTETLYGDEAVPDPGPPG